MTSGAACGILAVRAGGMVLPGAHLPEEHKEEESDEAWEESQDLSE